MLLRELLLSKNNNLDILRVIAALLVIYGHAPAFVENAANNDIVARLLGFDYSGSIAVKFFFMLSGMLVTLSIMTRPDFQDFLLKRAARIFPGLIICVSLTVLIVGPMYTQLGLETYFSNSSTWRYFLHNTTLFNLEWNLPGVFTEGKTSVVNGSLWTLPLEVICYLFLATFYTLGVWKNRHFATGFLVTVIALSFFSPQFLPVSFASNQEATALAGCFALGALFATHCEQIQVNGKIFVALALLAALLWATPLKILVFYLSFFYACIYVSAKRPIIKYFKLPGDPSYGVYIYGFVIQQMVAASFPQQGVVFNQAVSAVIALGVGFCSWYIVERPAIRWMKAMLSARHAIKEQGSLM